MLGIEEGRAGGNVWSVLLSLYVKKWKIEAYGLGVYGSSAPA
jgi:hypothetical protein